MTTRDITLSFEFQLYKDWKLRDLFPTFGTSFLFDNVWISFSWLIFRITYHDFKDNLIILAKDFDEQS